MLKKYLFIVIAAFGLSLTPLLSDRAQANQAAELSADLNVERAADGTEYLAADQEGRYRYWVNFNSGGALERVGSTTERGASENSVEQVYSAIQIEQAAAISSISAELERELNPSHYILGTRNSVGARLTPDEADILRAMPNIASVEREQVYQLDTFRGPEFIGADQIWTGAATPSGDGLLGEGMIAAVIDSGTNFGHPSFANVASCGHGVGGAPDKLISNVDCSSTGAGGFCDGPNPDDTGAHGTHTASTVAGNVVLAADDPNLNLPAPFTQISGVAPCAHVRAYKACPGTSCPGFNLQASMNNVLLDGDANALNFSISGGRNPWNDNDRVKLDMVAAGIFVAASAGNTRAPNPPSDPIGIPDPVGQVNHRGPWVMSVAASTRDATGVQIPRMSITAPGTLPVETQGIALTIGGDSPASTAFQNRSVLQDANQAAGFEGCNGDEGGVEFPAGFFDNAVALIQRGGCSFVNKINNAEAAGADMVIVWNNVAGIINMATTGTNIPAYSIIQTSGQAVSDFLDLNPTATLMSFGLEPSVGDELANFSLRGPTPAPLANLQKPNITAPGVGIFAADVNGPEYGFKSGTSMSAPHVAGSALLVMQANPDWSPMQVKSALQMTAIQEGVKDDFSTPWDWDDVGSGRVDLTQAALAGLVMDETFDNFIAANPAIGGDVRTLNLPSVRDVACNPDCSWTRTVSSALVTDSSWTVQTETGGDFTVVVEPASFTLGPQPDLIFSDGWEAVGDPVPASADQELTITVTNVSAGPIHFGVINLIEDEGLAPDAHITIAVQQ